MGTSSTAADRLRAAVGEVPARSATVVGVGTDDHGLGTTHHLVWRDLEHLHADLRVLGHLDLIVDASLAPGAAARLRRCVTALRPGGRLVVVRPRGAGALTRLLADLRRAVDRPPPLPRRHGDERSRPDRHLAALAASVVDLDVDDELVRLTCAVEAADLVGEPELDGLLADRPGVGRALDVSRPPADGAPGLRLRQFPDAICRPRGVAAWDDVLLPASFRDPYADRLKSPALIDWSEHSARPDLRAEPEALPGTWYLADNVMRGHFGHALTEQASLLWALPEARGRHRDLGLLVTTPWPSAPDPAPWEAELLAAFGADPARIHVARGPVRVERLLAATPAYVVQRHVHPVMRELYEQAGARLRAAARPRSEGAGPGPRRVFLTRTDDKRACRNRAAVEQVATDLGYAVVRPETLPLADQAALLGDAEVVAGFAGSALFHLALLPGPVRTVVVASSTYHAWNEQALGRLRGHDVVLVRAPADGAGMHASFTVDLDRLRTALA